METRVISAERRDRKIPPLKAVEARVSLSRQVADQLESLVLEGQIPVGDKLPTEAELCEQFGVSRTVVREAVANLKSLGLVETKRGVGTTVVRSSPTEKPFHHDINPNAVNDILDILELRMAVEETAAGLAAARRDEEDIAQLEAISEEFRLARVENRLARSEDYQFHLAIAQATKNPLIKAFFEQFNRNVIPRAKLIKLDVDQGESDKYLARVESEHAEIVEAIKAGDSEAAKRAMHLHLSRAYRLYQSYQHEES